MLGPIILDDHGDIEFYATVQDAQEDLEATDVYNQEYVAYNGKGQRMSLSVADECGSPRIVIAHTDENKGSELRGKLAEFFAEITGDKTFESRSLEELVLFGTQFFRLR